MTRSKAAVFFLLALILANLTMIAVAVNRYPAFWLQPGARVFAAEAVCALIVYAALIMWSARRQDSRALPAFEFAFVLGLVAAAIEISGMMLENNIVLHLHSAAVPIVSMLTLFAIWAYAGWRAARERHSARSGIAAALISAGVCMIVVVAAGFAVQLFAAPAPSAEIATWAEFTRSGWTDTCAFAIANTLDSAFTHLVIAPVLAALFGGIASVIGRHHPAGPRFHS